MMLESIGEGTHLIHLLCALTVHLPAIVWKIPWGGGGGGGGGGDKAATTIQIRVPGVSLNPMHESNI